MRPVVKPFSSSSEDEIYEMKKVYDDDNEIENLKNYIDSLVRSDDQKDVELSLTLIEDAFGKKESSNVIYELTELKVLALYRLGKDNECKIAIQNSEEDKKKTLIISNIAHIYANKKKQFNTKIIVGVAGAVLASAVVYYFISRK